MRKILLMILFVNSFIFAQKNNIATKDDIKMLSKQIEQMQYDMDKRFEQVDKRFEQIDKRFEQIDKRFEDLYHYMDKRFEDMNKRFEDMNKRFEDMNKRFEDMNKRFEDINDKFDMFLKIFLFGFSLIVSIVGFYIKKTYDLEKEIKAIAYDIQQKNNKKYFEVLVKTVEELAKKDKVFQEILENHNIRFATQKV